MAQAGRSQVYWRCRRGMLELDLLLLGFMEQGYDRLDAGSQSVFQTLLEYPDAVLLELLMGRAASTDPEVSRVVRSIRAAAAS